MRANGGFSNKRWQLRLFVAGQSPRSLTAIANLKRICDENLAGQHSIHVFDLLENPEVARAHQIVAVPTLVRYLPPPIRKIVGDLSNTQRVLMCLDLPRYRAG